MERKPSQRLLWYILKSGGLKRTVQGFSWPFMKGATTRLRCRSFRTLVINSPGPSLKFGRLRATSGWIPSLEQKEISQLHTQQWLNLKSSKNNPDCGYQRLSNGSLPLFPPSSWVFNRPVPNYMIQAIERLVWKGCLWWGLQGFTMPSWKARRARSSPDHTLVWSEMKNQNRWSQIKWNTLRNYFSVGVDCTRVISV